MFASSIDMEAMTILPRASFTGEVVVIDKIQQVSEAVEYLAKSDLLGFDTETRPSFSKKQQYRMSLLQLSSEDKAFLFRLNEIGLPNELADLLENEHIIKAGAAIHGDIKGIQRLRTIRPSGFVDLQPLARFCGISEISVRKMAAIVLKVRISKVQQLSNWETGQLSTAQQSYAATDAWICREIYKNLMDAEPEKCRKYINSNLR